MLASSSFPQPSSFSKSLSRILNHRVTQGNPIGKHDIECVLRGVSGRGFLDILGELVNGSLIENMP